MWKLVRAAKYSPAQVAIHGFHIIVLAACKGAQLVEGHSWRERGVTQSVATTLTESCQANPAEHQRTHVENRGSAGDTSLSGDQQLILFLQKVIDSRLPSYRSNPTWPSGLQHWWVPPFNSSCGSSNAETPGTLSSQLSFLPLNSPSAVLIPMSSCNLALSLPSLCLHSGSWSTDPSLHRHQRWGSHLLSLLFCLPPS